ncbi:cation diffusion facilitator family transporter [Uruburuella testudinis]|uniref:Cation diffusion facilitator family transporter n=1 Tax=Uruburuella testudinis TaxID=1282863 RepID=A0ABY4DQ83_9NEIS|nr:cation diffusion facilitator family transporter [Uruburuella testudinis]UOO81113.1 cation diffusion facilitator family transporter [Uruburuella testudinis]
MSHNHHNHAHDHGAHAHGSNKKVLRVSLLIIAAFMLVEIIGGLLTNSLALLSDAGHMFSDAAALGLSLAAFHFGERPGSRRNTFGYKRFEILAAALNGLTLLAIAAVIIYAAIGRFIRPPEIATLGMLAVSSAGLLVNIFVAWYMHRGGDTDENINMRGAYLHVLGDLLGSVGAIAAALLMMAFGWRWADPLASVVVALLIAKSGWGVLKSALHILMEGAPTGVDSDKIVAAITQVPGVESVHDLHIWTITSGLHVLSCHIVVDGGLTVAEAERISHRIEQVLQHQDISHVTVQTESRAHGHGDELVCTVRPAAHEDGHG